ncbi:MAG: hypothetical protein GY869_27640, partial [Planctomycetes bacterium]|nr:hypothetical protein [Planctomycetota bacterium]
DFQPYIYRTDDYGTTWTRLTTGRNGIPNDYPTRVVREDPDRQGLLYAGTEFGMFISFNDGRSWQKFQLNLPVTPITDLKVYRKDLIVSTMGRAFWIMDNVSILHQMNRQNASANQFLYAPQDAYRMRYSGSRGGGANPEYPSPGVHIDYYFAEESSGDVTLEIFDNNGKLVRGFSNSAPRVLPVTSDQLDIDEFHLEKFGAARLQTSPGMHRFVWDMRHAGSWNTMASSAGRSGPLVVPGTYQVKLTADNWSRTETFNILIDPRVAQDGVTQAVLEEQLNLRLKIRDTISRARMANDQINRQLRQATAQIQQGGRAARRAQATADRLTALQAKFNTAPGRYMTPMLVPQLSYLNSMLSRADQKPGRDAYQRHDELSGLLAQYIAELQQIINE